MAAPPDLLDSTYIKRLGSAKVTLNSATTTNFDFGTPDDINLLTNASYTAGDYLLIVADFSTTGSTDTTGLVVQDAADNAGAIDTTTLAASAVLVSGRSGLNGTVAVTSLAGGTRDTYMVCGVLPQTARPWIRVSATRAAGVTDTTVCQVHVFAVSPSAFALAIPGRFAGPVSALTFGGRWFGASPWTLWGGQMTRNERLKGGAMRVVRG